MPVPISQYVLKVHGRCNLACDHCYVYEHADQSWRYKPAAIGAETAVMAARRIAEHALAHELTEVSVILHGGEPLLLGKTMMRALLDTLMSEVEPVTGIDIRVHSNGVLLDEQWRDLFAEYGVKVGVSLDGDRAANDRHRRFADGRGSFPQVHTALALLRRPEYRSIYAGILCTIDLANDPIAVYQALVAEEPPRLDLLLPHATWETSALPAAGMRQSLRELAHAGFPVLGPRWPCGADQVLRLTAVCRQRGTEFHRGPRDGSGESAGHRHRRQLGAGRFTEDRF